MLGTRNRREVEEVKEKKRNSTVCLRESEIGLWSE